MQNVATTRPSERQFAALVDELAADPNRVEQLTDLLREDHSVYDQRGTATVVRMRGWVLVALARAGVSKAALFFVLEELDTGVDAYLVAAAARALRSYPCRTSALAPFVMRALTNIRNRDERVSFENYGDYAVSSAGTSPVRELLATLTWLGPHAREVLPDLELLCAQHGRLSRKLLVDVDRAVKAIRGVDQVAPFATGTCCALPSGNTFWAFRSRSESEPIESIVFEDHKGEAITFKKFFRGHPSIVVFFYTRCDNPLKCSLTVTKLARIQKLLDAQGLTDLVHTAAITYDPAFDLPERLRGYGQNRGLRMDACHRMLRATNGGDALRRHFKLGVNFIESLVNRHRIEAYILDGAGRIAASFERIHWDEQDVVDRTIEVLKEKSGETTCEVSSEPADCSTRRGILSPVFGTLAALGVAFFPKCPICWAGYLSMFGIAGLNQSPSPRLQPVLMVMMLANLASVWLRGRSTRRMNGFYLVSAGALMIVVSRMGFIWENAAVWGVTLTFAGSLLSALSATAGRSATPNSWQDVKSNRRA